MSSYESNNLDGRVASVIDSRSELDRTFDVIVTEVEQGQLEKAFNSINNLCLLYPQSDRVWQAYGVIASKLGRFEDGCRGLCRAVSLAPFNAQLYLDLSQIYENQDNLELARECLKTAISLEPSKQENRQRYVQLLIKNKDINEARSVLDFSQYPNDKFRDDYWKRINDFKYNKNFAELLSLGQELLLKGVRDPRLNYLMAVAFQNFNGIEEVITQLREVVVGMPAFAGAHKGLADYLKQSVILQKIVKLPLSEIFERSETKDFLTQLGEAESHYRISLEYDPYEFETYVYYGNLMRQLGKFKKALKLYQSAVAIQPDNANAHYNLASLYLKLNEYGPALDEINVTIELDKNFSEAHLVRAYLLSLLGKNLDAGKCYLSSMKFEPKFSTEAYFLD